MCMTACALPSTTDMDGTTRCFWSSNSCLCRRHVNLSMEFVIAAGCTVNANIWYILLCQSEAI
jgi:hypothetical protein